MSRRDVFNVCPLSANCIGEPGTARRAPTPPPPTLTPHPCVIPASPSLLQPSQFICNERPSTALRRAPLSPAVMKLLSAFAFYKKPFNICPVFWYSWQRLSSFENPVRLTTGHRLLFSCTLHAKGKPKREKSCSKRCDLN